MQERGRKFCKHLCRGDDFAGRRSPDEILCDVLLSRIGCVISIDKNIRVAKITSVHTGIRSPGYVPDVYSV